MLRLCTNLLAAVPAYRLRKQRLTQNCHWQSRSRTKWAPENIRQHAAIRPVTICVINPKEGCGKSSFSLHLAGHFARTGMNVFRVDANRLGPISRGFGSSAAVGNLSVATLVERNSLEAPDGDDLVVIDCPPDLYQCSWNALLAADFVVIPIPPEDFGIEGLRVVHEAIVNAHRLNPRLRLLGHIVTRFDARLLEHKAFEKWLREIYGNSVFKTVIPEAPAFALDGRSPVRLGENAERIGALANELLRRIGLPTQTNLA